MFEHVFDPVINKSSVHLLQHHSRARGRKPGTTATSMNNKHSKKEEESVGQGDEDGLWWEHCLVGLTAITCVWTVCMCPYCSGVELHFEFFQIEPLFGLAGVQVMVEVTGSITKAVELPVWSQQDGGWSLLIGHTRVPAFPTPARKSVIIYVP